MPKFSVIIATYNQLELLKKCVEALEQQSFKDFDVHICDDGSTDGTREYFEHDGRVIYHYQKNKGNFGANLNQAIYKAKGEYFVFIAADSMPEQDYLEVLNAYAAPHRLVCGIRIQIDEIEGKWQGVDIDYRIKKNIIPQVAVPVVGRAWNMLTGNGLCVPAEAFQIHGPFSEKMKGYGGEDTELVARLFFKGYVCWSVPDMRLYHHWHKSKPQKSENNKLVNRMVYEYSR